MITIIGGDGKPYGPVPVDQVKRWMLEGRATLDTLARRDGDTDWRKLGELPEFSTTPTPPPLQPPLTEAAAPSEPGAATPDAATPTQDVAPEGQPAVTTLRIKSGPKLAGRGIRLLAAIIDGILSMLFALPGLVMLSARLVANGGHMPAFGTPAFDSTLSSMGVILVGWIILMIIQGWLLATRGQTVGKKLMGIRIVRFSDDANPGFVHAVLLRAVVVTILDNIPWLGLLFWLVDCCFIFREDRRCIHDLIADTRVIDE